MFMMIHVSGNKNCKLGEGPQKLLDKNDPQKPYEKPETLSENSKFSLQYNTLNGQTMKTVDKKVLRSLTPQHSRVLGSSRANLTVPGVQDGRGKAVRDKKPKQMESREPQLSDKRKISSLPFLTTPSTKLTDSKSDVTTTRRLTKTSVAAKVQADSKTGLLPSKPEWKRSSGSNVQKCSPSPCKTEIKTTTMRMVNSKKSTNSPPGMMPKEPEKVIKSTNSAGKKSGPVCKSPETRVQVSGSAKREDKTRPTIPERSRKKCTEEERKVIAKERSRSQEVKRLKSKESSVKLDEIVERKRSERKILFSALEKSTSYLGLREKNRETGNVALDFPKKKLPPTDFHTPVARNTSTSCHIVTKENLTLMHNTVIDSGDFKENRGKANDVEQNTSPDNSFQRCSSRPVDDYLSLESLERLRRDEELLTLDKRIWSNLEVQIRETCEKTDILYDSEEDSSESISDIIHRLFSNREDEDLMDCLESSENRAGPRKSLDYRDNWNALSIENKSNNELWKGFPETTKVSVEPTPKDLFERPKSRRAIEDTLYRKITPESKRTKSSEDSKMRDSKQEFRTKSLSSDMKWRDIQEEHHGKGTKERKTVNFLDDYKLGSKCVSSSFFHTHKNVGFIGKDVDGEYMSFEPGQVTLYQPHESQMLLYDIANCAATQGYLKMCGIGYDVAVRKNAEQMSPSGRVPFISSSLCIIPEFEAIVSFMQYKKFACIPVKENDKPAFRAIISMLVDVLETAERYICWYDQTTLLNYTRPRTGGHYPFPLNHIMHWKKKHEERSRLSELGYSGRSFDLILGDISSCFRTLSSRLGNNSFFFGNNGTEVDALVYGHVYALFTTEVDGPLRDLQFIIQQYPNLVSFACNFDKTYSLNKFSSLELSCWDNILNDGRYPSDASFTIRT